MGGVRVLVSAGLRGRRRSGLLTTFLVLVLAAFAIAVGLSVIDQGARQVDAAAREANVAHLVLSGERAALEEAAGDTAITGTTGPLPTTVVRLELEGGAEDTRLSALDDPAVDVGRPLLRAGRWLDPAHDDEVVLDRSAVAELGLAMGDPVTFTGDGGSATYTLVGAAIDLTDCGFPQCDPIRGWVTTPGLERLGGAEYHMLLARLVDATPADAVAARLLATVPGIGGTESWPDTRGDFLAVDRIFGQFITVFGVFVLVAASIVVAGSMVVRMTARRREIGLLEAVGCTGTQVTLALVAEHLVIGLLAAAAGWGLAGLATPALQIGVADVIGRSSPTWSVATLLVTAAVLSVILVVATVVPAWRAGRLPVSDVVRDVPPGHLSGLARRVAGVPRYLPALGIKEAAARPARSILASLAVALAVVTAIVAMGFIATIGEAIDSPERVGDPWDASVVPGEGATAESLESAIAATPEVASWFTETGRRTTIGDQAFLSQAIGGDPAAAAFEIGEGRRVERPGEAIIGYGMVRRFGLDVGDDVTFSVSGGSLTADIVGWYRELEDSGEVLQYRLEQLQEIDPDATADVVRVTATAGVEPPALAAALERSLGASAEVEAFEADADELGAFESVLQLIALVVGIVAAVNLLSVMMTSTRESARAIGIEQSLGFTPRQIVVHGAIAAAGLGILGAAAGVPAGLWVYGLMGDAVSSVIGAGPGFGRAPSTSALAVLVLVAIAIAAVAGALATRRLARWPAADLVRWE
jgi:putative ABC transport system permease protein